MSYTVTNKTDPDLAGLKGRLVMHFVDGSAIEVTPEEVKAYQELDAVELENDEVTT